MIRVNKPSAAHGDKPAAQSAGFKNGALAAAEALTNGFVFSATTEGKDYWCRVVKRLQRIAGTLPVKAVSAREANAGCR